MQQNQYTERAQQALATAHQLTERGGNPEITPVHLLSALLADRQGTVRPLVAKAGGNLEQMEQMIEAELGRLPEQSGEVNLGRALGETLNRAGREAEALKD